MYCKNGLNSASFLDSLCNRLQTESDLFTVIDQLNNHKEEYKRDSDEFVDVAESESADEILNELKKLEQEETNAIENHNRDLLEETSTKRGRKKRKQPEPEPDPKN